MIIRALSKSPWGAGLVNTDIGSDIRLAQHNLQIPAHASNKIIPPYLFPRNFSRRIRLTSSRPDAILITPYQGSHREEGGPCWDVGGHAQGLGVGLEIAGQGLPDSRVVGPM
eukprot:172328-Pelagomonas_calceolata.AAC.1